MLEQKIEALTTAVEALTAILTSQGGAAAAAPAAATAAKTEDKAPAAADKPKRTTTKAAAADKPEVQAAVNEVKENFDVATAKALIKAAGFDKLGDVTEDKFDELYEAAKAKMAELEGDDGEEGGDDGL